MNFTTLKKNPSDSAILLLRIGIGALMLSHGIPKLLKLFGEEVQFADPFGIGALPSLFLAVFAEVFCSLFLIVGFKTRLATIPLIITMVVAALMIHGQDPWAVKEKAVFYLMVYLGLLVSGGGEFSLDKKKFTGLKKSSTTH